MWNNEDKKNKTSTKYNIYLFLNLRQMWVISGMASMRRTPPGFEFVVIAIIIITIMVINVKMYYIHKNIEKIDTYLKGKTIYTWQVVSDGFCTTKVKIKYYNFEVKSKEITETWDLIYPVQIMYPFHKIVSTSKNCSNGTKIKKEEEYICRLYLSNNFLNHWEKIKNKDTLIKLINPRTCVNLYNNIKKFNYRWRNLLNFVKKCDIQLAVDNHKKYVNCKTIELNPNNVMFLDKNKIAVKLQVGKLKNIYVINNITNIKEFIIDKTYNNIIRYSLDKFSYIYSYSTAVNKWLLALINLSNWNIDVYYWHKISKIMSWNRSDIKDFNYEYSSYTNKIYVLIKMILKNHTKKYILLKVDKKTWRSKLVFDKVLKKDDNISSISLSWNELILKDKVRDINIIKVF